MDGGRRIMEKEHNVEGSESHYHKSHPKGTECFHSWKIPSHALCNTVYKIISKVIANWSKPLLDKLTSQEQGGFVGGRQIRDGVIVAQEAVHSQVFKKKLGVMIKLDMVKGVSCMTCWIGLI